MTCKSGKCKVCTYYSECTGKKIVVKCKSNQQCVGQGYKRFCVANKCVECEIDTDCKYGRNCLEGICNKRC